MGVDEAGHDDHPRGVDQLGIPVHQARSDREDLVPLDEDVSGGELADVPVQAENGPSLDQLPSGGHNCEVVAGRIEGRKDGGFGRRLPITERRARR